VLVTHAKKLREQGNLNLFWTVCVAPWAVLGLVLDVAFQMTFGFMFLEPPREILFSGRVQRIVRTGSGWRLKLAAFWMRQLNAIDAEHIRL